MQRSEEKGLKYYPANKLCHANLKFPQTMQEILELNVRSSSSIPIKKEHFLL